MEQALIKAINQEVYRRFPEVKGKRPKVQVQQLSKNRAINKAKTYLLIYSSQVQTSSNATLSRIVRVVVNASGEILKISTSR
jgi:hypothetical protein